MSKQILCNPYDFMKMAQVNRNNTKKLLNVPAGYVMHHRDERMMYDDPERYAQWNPEDLVVMSKQEHLAWHSKGKLNGMYGKKHSKHTIELIKEKNIGVPHPHTPEQNRKIGESGRGKHPRGPDGKFICKSS